MYYFAAFHHYYILLLIFFNQIRYEFFVARVLLAAIDHNMHIFRPHATTDGGALKYARKYSKRTKKWRAEPVKIKKRIQVSLFSLSTGP